VDIICGGFPCQDISAAGKGEGITGAKSGLWREYARVVCELGPTVAVVENSPMLTSRGLGVVLGDLAELGYDAEWTCLGACDVGAPHRRWRLFIVAWHPDRIHEHPERQLPQRCQPIAHPGRGSERCSDSPRRQETVPDTASAGEGRVRVSVDCTGCYWLSEPAVGRVAHGVSAGLDCVGPRLGPHGRKRLHALGNAVVPQVAYQVGLWVRHIMEREA